MIDEIDCRFHPKLVEMLICLFQNPDLNTHGAQLIFTTHTTALMNSDLFRRDQIYFTQKNNKGETQLTCLAEYANVRADTNFEKWYREGRFEAVPKLDYQAICNMIKAFADTEP